jgi:NAD+ synthase (glutamine-hydrolysing)
MFQKLFDIARRLSQELLEIATKGNASPRRWHLSIHPPSPLLIHMRMLTPLLEDQNWKYVAMAACKYTFWQSMITQALMTDRDHFLEGDTDMHCWESLSEIIQHPDCQDILLDIGMPVKHKDVRYNCRLICYNKEILLIRPKLYLANDGNYYEM